jgi:hypothetical protein
LFEYLFNLIKFAPGHPFHLWKLMALPCNGLGVKGFYLGRDKSGLEGMT